MLDAIKHITDGNFFFQEDTAQVHCVCNTIQLSEMWFSCFHVLPGSAEAQVIWGGIVKRLLIAYFISNISAKNMSKSIHVRQSYSEPKVGRFFETWCTCVVVCLTAVDGCCISSQDSVAGTDGREACGTGCMHCEGVTVDRLRKGTYSSFLLLLLHCFHLSSGSLLQHTVSVRRK